MSEMVATVARALKLCATGDPARCELGSNRCLCRSAARAAIKAMREPTEAMETAAYGVCGPGDYPTPTSWWQAMIGAALKSP